MLYYQCTTPLQTTQNQGVRILKYTDCTQSKAMKTPFLTDVQKLKSGLILFRRSDVQHKNWYCRVKVPNSGRYKTISLKTADMREATDKAFDIDGDIRFRIRHDVPVFDKSFAEVAREYSDLQKRKAGIGEITRERWITVDGHIRLHLIPYIGNHQITTIHEDHWTEYPFWRKENNAPKKAKKHPLHKQPKARRKKDGDEEHQPAKNGSIRLEMMTFRAIMNYAARKNYIRESQVPRGPMPEDKSRREEFTATEYRKLHTFAREWIKKGDKAASVWYRDMAYNFMLVMANTGMRTMEARNLKWRDISARTDRQGRPFVAINVRGKGKYRELVAAPNVGTYDKVIFSLMSDHPAQNQKAGHGIFANYPEDWMQHYAENGYEAIYPVRKHIPLAEGAFSWNSLYQYKRLTSVPAARRGCRAKRWRGDPLAWPLPCSCGHGYRQQRWWYELDAGGA